MKDPFTTPRLPTSGECFSTFALDRQHALCWRRFEILPSPFKNYLPLTLFADFSSSARKEVQKIETEQAAQRDNRFMRRLEPLIQTLESYSGVLDTLCQGYPPMSFVWGPLKLMLVLAKNYTTIMDIILQAFSDIADALPRIDRLKATFPKDANLNRAVALIYADILEFHGRAYKMFTRRAWHYYFAFNWGFFERRFKSVLHNLRRHCELLDKEAAIAHFAEMRSDRDQRKCEDKAFEHRRRIQMSRDVFVLLSASEGPQEDKLRRISDTRQLGTCDWIFDDPQLKPWIEGSLGHDALWVNGIPGSGKTYITSLLVEHLQSRDNGCCGYFFCDQKVSTGVDCVNILRTLAVQIFQQNEDITPLIHEIFIEKLSTYSSSAIKKMLIQIIPHVKPTHIVLDGIDELNIPLQEDILKIMLEVVRNSNHNCKLLVVSREEPQIRKFFLGKQMKLEAQTAEGLRQYINRSMDELRSQHTTMEPALIKDINLNLHKKAKGMFLWVRLVTANLLEKGSLLEIETAMNELPDGLDKAYDRILNRFRCVNDSLRRRIFKIFHWLSVTRRPLSVHEVIDGIALDFHQPLLNRKTRINNVQHAVLDLCAPLLEITTHGTLELVHFSAKEYILASGSGPFTKEHQAHFEVAKCCVLNLNSMVDLIPNFTELTDNEIEKLVVQGQYGLHDYASEFWAEHLLHYKAYNAESGNAGNENENKLIYELHRLTRMVKGSYAAQAKDQPVLRSETLSVGLRKLEDEPKIWRLITSHVTMSEKIEAVKGKYSEVKDQETQLLLSDETHLTQIKLRLREIREKILSRISGDLPAHISELDYESFRSRYRFCCKNVGCSQNFQSAKERDDHQQRHMITFPCPDCDFSFRGFSSRRDLDRHLAKYHRSPAEIDIPSSIQSVGFGKVAGTIGNRHNFEERWTECGRQAKKNSFRQILKVLDATLNSPKTAHAHTSQKPTADQFDQLGLLEKNIEQRNYETLEQFKNDVRSIISAAYPERNKENEAIIEYSCYNGLKCVSNTYPGFAAAEFAPSRNFFEMSIGTGQNDLSRLTGRDIGNTETTLSEGSSPQRRVYWSKMDATEFPSLLKRFGKDFGKIADTLKTKTEDDVARFYDHFTENGKSDPCETPKSSVSIDYPENAEPNPAFGEAISNDQSLSAVSVPELATFPAQDVHFLQNVAESNHASMNQQRDVSAAPRPKNKRRQRRRAFCPFCTDYPDGLHDEYALRKHYNRVHCPTRKVRQSLV